MKNSIVFILFLILYISVSGLVFGQDFMQSQAMNSFNMGRYEDVVDQVPDWIEENNIARERQGVALYFLAESFYNLGLTADDRGAAFYYFEESLANFEQCVTRADIRVEYPKYLYMAGYRTGWCHFRLAESGSSNAAAQLGAAYASFSDTNPNAPDSLKILSSYMAGESRLRQVILRRYNVFSKQSALASEINELLRLLNDAGEHFRTVVADEISNELKFAASLRLKDVYYARGKVYQGASNGLFDNLNDPNKQDSPSATARFYFEQADYSQLFSQVQGNQTLARILLYSGAMRYLSIYLQFQDDFSSLRFTDKIDSLENNEYDSEKLFRRGNHDHATEMLTEGPFYELSTQNSFYRRAAADIPEAWYWFGFIKSILNQDDALENFERFLQALNDQPANMRQRILMEDARWRAITHTFENTLRIDNRRQRRQQLDELQSRMDEFQPNTGRVQQEKQRLMTQIQISKEIASGRANIASNIYQNVLNSNLDMALDIVKELLPLSASVTGESRARYIDVLDILFSITEDRRPNETQFYRGVTISLNAEIQAVAAEKEVLFEKAAETLDGVGGIYADEAEYVRARALFFAEKFNDAQRLLTNLINEEQSVRALFYLGELFREKENGNAARSCFEQVMDVTENKEDGDFWYNNAQAAINLCNNQGPLNVLNDVDIDGVDFPDELLTVDGTNLTYEKLADYDYLQSEKAQQSIALLMQFGLPKRTLYPSVNQLEFSQFVAEGIFPDFQAPIDEKTGAITSGLELRILFPQGISGENSTVELDGESLTPEQTGIYSKELIPLNAKKTIKITTPGCYPYIEEHTFTRAGADTVLVNLTPTLKYVKKDGDVGIKTDLFPKRLDQNIILQQEYQLTRNSKLYRDFAENIYLRDYAFHNQLEKILIVDANHDRILSFPNSDVAVARGTVFPLDFGAEPDSMDSPEGIAIDSDGTIYIADWGNHRILVFDNNGSLLRKIGSFGKENNIGEPVKFIFPNRIAIAEDKSGALYENKRIFREQYLYVTDRNGVHLVDDKGHYLDTFVSASSNFPKGSFYGIGVKGYGKDSELYLARRKQNEIIRFLADTD